MAYADKIKDYLHSTKAANTHTGKLIAFSELLKSVFGVTSYEVVPNVEQCIKSGGLMILKGRMDLRLGQTIMGFKIDLAKEFKRCHFPYLTECHFGRNGKIGALPQFFCFENFSTGFAF
jgi:hypothetical protein